MLTGTTVLATLLSLIGSAHARPQQIRGVNLGNFLIYESWMSPKEWASMGGERCDEDCTKCASTEYTLTKKLGQAKADKVFDEHWTNWFTQADVDLMKNYGLNSVRMPVGWWVIEELKGDNDYFPGGQLAHLKRGLRMLKEAGIWVLLDVHANPGVQSALQQFTGWCRAEPHFYEADNYAKDLRATAVLASLIHTDPDFSTVFGLEAVNEPEVDPADTPGLLQFYDNFVGTVREVERWHGMSCSDRVQISTTLDEETKDLIKSYWKKAGVDTPAGISDDVSISEKHVDQAGSNECISTTFMASSWQYVDSQANKPSTVANGDILYDQHLYYSFGGVADATEAAYMQDVCNGTRFQDSEDCCDEEPNLAFLGEWWLATEWTPDADGASNQTNNAFYCDFGDAQKMQYAGNSKGWFFWSWKLENTDEFGYTRDYRQAVGKGILTADPDAVFIPEVCEREKYQPKPEEPKTSASASASGLSSASASGAASAVSTSSASSNAAPQSAKASASASPAGSRSSGPARLAKSTDSVGSSSRLGAIPAASDDLSRWR